MLIASRFAGISAFACGAVIAMVVLAARQDLTAAPAIYVHTCAATDGSLRHIEATVACAPEERRIRITVPGKKDPEVGSSRVDLQACKLEYSIVSPK